MHLAQIVSVKLRSRAAEILREGVADQFWEAEMGDLPRPSDSEELADAYFDEMGSHGEFFTIHETTLQGS